MIVSPGEKYRHFKGDLYEIVGVALDKSTDKPVIVYKPLYDCKYSLFVRPYDDFFMKVDQDFNVIKRFSKIED